MEIDKISNKTFFSNNEKPRIIGSVIKTRLAAALLLFFVNTSIFAQVLCETEPATTDGNLQNSNQFLDATIIGIAVMIVLFTLVMSIKYLFQPGEKNPEHIKNIVKDEGF